MHHADLVLDNLDGNIGIGDVVMRADHLPKGPSTEALLTTTVSIGEGIKGRCDDSKEMSTDL